MHFKKFVILVILPFALNIVISPCNATEQDQTASRSNHETPAQPEIEALKAEIAAIRAEYENRIQELESRLEDLEKKMLRSAPETEIQPAVPSAVSSQTRAGALNPAVSVIGNLVGRADSHKVLSEEGDRIDNKLLLREAEIDMRIAVDPYADGVLITSLESESPSEFSAGVEEGYVNIKKLPFLDRPPLGLKIKAGRFRPLFGTINILHTHDLPQTNRPLVIQEFLGPEGFVQHGISTNFFLPVPGEESSLDLTLEALTGGNIAVSPHPDSRFSYLGHLRYYSTLRDTHNLELGWSSYFHPKGNNVPEADIHAFNFMYRWKPVRQGEWKSFILGSELIFGRKSYPGAALSPEAAEALAGRQPGNGKPLGYYLFAQWQFDRRTYAGIRWDKTDVLFDPALKRHSITPFISYYFSEFLRFRLNYEYRWSDLFTEDGRNSVYGELNFVFGSHPPEPFWVNK